MLCSRGHPVSSLYVHVPFCARKCAYCAFYSDPLTSDPDSGSLIPRYLSALQVELKGIAARLKPATIFFGGGTPSVLGVRHWETLLKNLAELGLLGSTEWTIECNPATVSLEKARLWRDYGVSRLSLGVQSLDEPLLERLGRIHTRAAVFRSFDILRQAGFDNLSLDLMFAIPGQTLDMWQSTLGEIIAMQSEHLSCYELIYEEDTTFFARLKAGEYRVDEDLACAMYEALLETAEAAGFAQYEIANFARRSAGDSADVPKLACRHNVNYWRGGAYYGAGPSAVSYMDGNRFGNVADVRRYCDALEASESPVEWRDDLPGTARAGEIAAFGLRMNSGWPFKEFQNVTGMDLRQEWHEVIGEMVKKGWGELDEGHFRLTQTGMRFADAAAAEFLRK